MKRIKGTMKCVVATLAFCLLLSVSMLAEAATFKPGVTYIDPAVNSKQEYYSVLKKRMYTYSDDTIEVVYPKGATLSVKTNKKALQAEIVGQTFEEPWYTISNKVYVNITPDPANVTTYYYYITKDGDKWELTQEGDRFYTELDWNKVYLTPNRTERAAYAWIKVGELTDDLSGWEYDEERADGYYAYVRCYDDGDGKGYYYNGDYSQYENYNTVKTPDGQADYEYSTAIIQLTSSKAGTYTVSVDVNGQVTKLKVYVSKYAGDRRVSVTLDKKILSETKRKASDNGYTDSNTSEYKVSSSLKSGKLKVKAESGVKITGLIVATVNKNGKMVYKKVKNGKKISLSQYLAQDDRSLNGSYNRSSKKRTYVYVSYKDTKLGTSTTYTVTKKHGVQEVKRTIKYASNSKKYVDYLSYGNGSTFSIWSY